MPRISYGLAPTKHITATAVYKVQGAVLSTENVTPLPPTSCSV